MARAAHSRRAGETRNRGFGTDRFARLTDRKTPAVTDLENFLTEPHWGDRRYRFLHCTDDPAAGSVRVSCARASTEESTLLRRHRTSERRMDRATGGGSLGRTGCQAVLGPRLRYIYGNEFRRRVKSLGMKEVISAPRSPWQNAFAERLIGSIRRECLDHVVVLSQRHLRKLLKSYFAYYTGRGHIWHWKRMLPNRARS